MRSSLTYVVKELANGTALSATKKSGKVTYLYWYKTRTLL